MYVSKFECDVAKKLIQLSWGFKNLVLSWRGGVMIYEIIDLGDLSDFFAIFFMPFFVLESLLLQLGGETTFLGYRFVK